MAKPRSELEINTPGNGNYDQVVGMSQGIINKSFRDMFDFIQKKDQKVAKLFLSTKDDGTLNAVLDAPSVVLMGNVSSMVEVYYVLRVKSGFAEVKDGTKIDLAGWTFAVNTPLKRVTITPTAEDPPELKAQKEEALKTLGATYKGFIPGDYRVQRIFCALAQASWSEPEGYWSIAYDKGKKMKLSEWKAAGHSAHYDDLMDLLRQWAKKQKDERISSLGITFELEGKKKDQPDPTFEPVEINTQVYPFRTTANPNGQNGYGDYGPESKLIEADYNCLLYCEMVHSGHQKHPWLPDFATRKIPAQPKVEWTSNFAQPSSQGEEIPGTFAMDHRVWLEAFVLPQLQELCMATKLTCGPGKCWDDDGHRMSPTYALGCPLSGQPSIDASDSSFAFSRVTDGHYKWSASSSAPNNGNVHEYYTTWYQPNCFNRFYYSSSNEVNVKWSPGTTKFKVDGSVIYDYKTTFANDRGMSRDISEKKYKVKGVWNFDIDILDPTNVLMQLKVDRSKFKTVSGSSVPEGFSVSNYDVSNDGVIGKTMEAIQDTLSSKLSSGITKAEGNIADRFKHAGQLTFPGHGALKFRKPMLTKQGNLVAIAEYASTDPDGTMSFPDPSLPTLNPPSRPPPLTSQFPDVKADMGNPKLHWSMDFKYDPGSKNGILSFTGTNETSNDPVRLEYIRVLFVPKTTVDTRLFPATTWKEESQSWIAKAVRMIRDMAAEEILSWFREDVKPAQHGSGSNPPAPAPQGGTAAEGEEGRKPKKKGDQASESEAPPKIRDDNVYGFAYSENWTGVRDLVMKVKSDSSLALKGDLSRPKDEDVFSVARGQSVTVIFQGKVPGPGYYQIKVQEEWAAPEGKEKSTQEETASWDWKLVQIFEDGRKPDFFDISEKEEELSKLHPPTG